jgi:anti-sigma regulatory factor (Ser/Thr protein kinase)
MFYAQTKEKSLKLVFKIDDSLDFIYSDEIKIKQIIKNLLSNSLKFTKEGKIYFFVEDYKTDIKITIQDEGIGIPQDKIEYIFDRFKQLDGTRTRKYGGTGLGLTICKELITLLNGKINVTSQVGVGTTFEVIIPKNNDLVLEENIDNHQKVEESSNDEINNISIEEDFVFENDKNPIEKELIYILNNDPIYFLNLIIELNKKYIVKQVAKTEELLLIGEENFKIIVDISKLKDNDIKIIKDLYSNNLILLYEDIIEEELRNKASRIYQKPLSKDIILSL